MNYEEMSDDKLSELVLKAIHGNIVDYWCLSDCGKYIYDCGPAGDQFYKIDLIDINNPSDMWPIIEEVWERLMQVDSYYQAHTKWEAYCIEHDVGKLRAAAICFLKMKDSE